MKIGHLTVVLDAEIVVLITTNAESAIIYSYYSIPRGSLEDMKLYHVFLGGVNDLELGEAHLEHHVRLVEHDLMADHDESARC